MWFIQVGESHHLDVSMLSGEPQFNLRFCCVAARNSVEHWRFWLNESEQRDFGTSRKVKRVDAYNRCVAAFA
jgi:hypothetical protein